MKLADVRGKFDVERAKALGVKPGKLFSDLIRGVIVKSETGEEVTPQQCLGPNVPGPVVLLIDCPDASYALSLFSLTDLQVSLSRADFVCHLGDSAVVSSSEYAAWLGKFCSDKVQHVLLNASCSQQPLFRSAALVQEALARVASVFSEHSQSPRAQAPSPVWPHRCASVGESLTLAPPKLAGFTPCPSRAPLPVSEQLQGEPVREAAWLDQTMEFGFLGTGASRPSKLMRKKKKKMRSCHFFSSFFSKGIAMLLVSILFVIIELRFWIVEKDLWGNFYVCTDNVETR